MLSQGTTSRLTKNHQIVNSWQLPIYRIRKKVKMTSVCTNELQAIRSQSLSSAIFKQLQQLIFSGKILLGERINESRRATIIAINRGPIRESEFIINFGNDFEFDRL